MSANVRCGGLPAEYQTGQQVEPETGPCGWKGERIAWKQVGPDPIHQQRDTSEHALTRYPCPICGGRVELIGVGAP